MGSFIKDIPDIEVYPFLLFVGYRTMVPLKYLADLDFSNRETLNSLIHAQYITVHPDHGYFLLSEQGHAALCTCRVEEFLFCNIPELRECAKRYVEGIPPNIGQI